MIENNKNELEPESHNNKKQENILNIECSEEIAQGAYSNLAMSNFNKEEFLLDFVFVQPGGKKGKVRSRIILSPKNAKRLALMLADNIKKYEEKCGPITDEPQLPGIQLSSN